MADFNKLMKQAQKMQKEMESAQSALADTEVTFQNNGVDVTATCDYTIKSIKISDELIQSNDAELISDVTLIAVNGALKLVREKTESQLSGITGGLDLSSLM